jgi:nucleoside-diphosphate-sugar epimerase
LERWVRTGFRHDGRIDAAFEEAWDRSIRERCGLPLVTLRLFRVYGPGQRSDELIPGLLQQARDGRGVVVREASPLDLVHVDDVVEAYLRAARSLRPAGSAIEIGGGRLLSPAEVGRAVLDAIGSPRAVSAPASSGGGHAARIETAREALGWKPRIALETGVRRLWRELAGEAA